MSFKKLFLGVSLLAPLALSAQTKLDRDLLEYGIVDENYIIIDDKAYSEIMRLATNKVTPMLPLRVDSITTALGFNINRFGYYATYSLDGVETIEQADELMNSGFGVDYKNYICSLDYGRSLVFKKNNMNINLSILNTNNQVIQNFKFPFRDC